MTIEKYLNKIICDDCVKTMRRFPDECIDLTVTSPPYDCFSEDTEILTLNGWKSFNNVTLNDLVMTLNMKYNLLEWQQPQKIYRYNFNGNLYHFFSQNIDLLVTANHRFPIRENRTGIMRLIKSSNLKTVDYLPLRGFNWDGDEKNEFILPSYHNTWRAGPKFKTIRYDNRNILSIDMDNWLKFFGFFLAEGWTGGSKGGKRHIGEVAITQITYQDIAKDVLNGLPFKWNQESYKTFVIHNKQLWDYLKQFGNSFQKFIPIELKNLCRRQLNILLKYYLLGNGHRKNDEWKFAKSSSERLRNDIQEIILKLGYNSHLGANNVISCKRSNFSLLKNCLYNKFYSGPIYCLEVPNHTILVRRNGIPVISGNSLRDYQGYDFDFKSIANELFRVTKNGGVVVWVVGDATTDGSETGTSFRQALYFKDIGFKLHDTMIYGKDSSPYPSGKNSNRYTNIFEYMFIFSKKRPKIYNLITDKKNKNHCQTASSYRQKNGSLKRIIPKQIKTYGIRNNIWYYLTGYQKSTRDKIAFNMPALFPEKLAEDHIKSWSNQGNLILDPMCGSGTTCKMAKLLNRNFIGIDISEEYCNIARRRISLIPEKLSNWIELE